MKEALGGAHPQPPRHEPNIYGLEPRGQSSRRQASGPHLGTDPSRHEVRIKFKDHEVNTTISKRARNLLKNGNGLAAGGGDNDSYSLLK